MPRLIMAAMLFVSMFKTTDSFGQDKSAVSEISFASGYSRHFDTAKNDANMLPTGPAYKLGLGARKNLFDIKLMFRYARLDNEFTYQSTAGELVHKEFSMGTEVGMWILPFLRPKLGYAVTTMDEKVNGNFTSTQLNNIKQTYHSDPTNARGVYYGGEMSFLRFGTVQLYGDYTYYHFNLVGSHTWEALVGLRIYTHSKIFNSSGSGNSSSSSKSHDFFEAIYKMIFGQD